MDAGFFRAFVPAEVVVAVGEVYVFFVEDGGPLEGGACVVHQYVSTFVITARTAMLKH